jgi:uncharacterized protein YciI
MYQLLFYEYADGAVDRRAPHRPAHLALARQYQERGELLLGGAYADPVDGAVLVFRADAPSVAESFARQDPYVANGVVVRWRVRPWSVVVGSLAGPA